jgi:photoactive yellow protein
MTADPISFDQADLARAVEQLTTDVIDVLPFGVVKLDANGQVLFYSQREGQQSGRGMRPVIGMGFFTDIAPCMDNPSFKGRIEAAMASGTLDAEFSHVGDFSDRDRELQVRAQSATDGGVWLFLRRPT